MEIAKELGRIVGSKNMTHSKTESEPFSRDRSYFKGSNPLVVVRPKNTQEISSIMKLCNKNRINVTVRGGGSSLTGSTLPAKNSIVIDLSKLTRILEIHLEDGYVVAEPGVLLGDLNKRLSKYKYFYPPDPASAAFASVGGTISTNAGGLRSVMYGSTKLWVIGLEVVLPDGEIIQTGGRTAKRSVGYDFTSLIVGSEGTLGVVTKAILKVIPKPEAIGRLVAYYNSTEGSVAGITKLKRNGVVLLGAEFLDSSSIDLIKKYRKVSVPDGTRSLLIIDLPSTTESLDRVMKNAQALLAKTHPLKIDTAKSEKGMEKLLEIRRHLYQVAYEIAKKDNKRVFASDVVVPTSRLAKAIKGIKKEIKNYGFDVEIFSHIGDGNIHVNVIADKSDMKRVYSLLAKFADVALNNMGSVSGEHGIGLEKKHLLLSELKKRHSMALLGKMQGIKHLFDPNGILNKGKVFD